MRWSYYGENFASPEFATRLRNNTITDDPKLGGKTGQRLINHSFGSQIPTEKYGKEHPEYFALRDGKRLRRSVQLAERTGARLYLSDEGGEDWTYAYAGQYEALKRMLDLGVENIYAHTKPLCDRLRKELPSLGYRLITPPEAVSSLVVAQAKALRQHVGLDRREVVQQALHLRGERLRRQVVRGRVILGIRIGHRVAERTIVVIVDRPVERRQGVAQQPRRHQERRGEGVGALPIGDPLRGRGHGQGL